MEKILFKKNWFKSFIFVCCILSCTLSFSACNFSFTENSDGNNKIFSRSATNNDLYLDLSEEFSFSINYKITPKVDISSLQVSFTYYDKNHSTMVTKVCKIGNVKEGIVYTVSVSLAEFSFIEIFKIQYVSARVTGGTVSYF